MKPQVPCFDSPYRFNKFHIQSHGSEQYRGPNRPDFIAYDKSMLSGHPDPRIMKTVEVQL